MLTLAYNSVMRSYIGELKYNLFIRWGNLTPQQRGKALFNAVKRTMLQVGVPKPQLIFKDLPLLEGGCFNPFNQWSITINSKHLPNGGMDVGQAFPALAISIADTIYHEMRHCEQFWHVARYLATNAQSPSFLAQQVKPPAVKSLVKGSAAAMLEGAIYIRRMTGIPFEITKRAMAEPMISHPDPMEKLAKDCYKSVYGASNRDMVLTALSLTPRKLPNEPATLLNDFRGRIHQKYSGSLPEEVDAWRVGGMVRTAMGG